MNNDIFIRLFSFHIFLFNIISSILIYKSEINCEKKFDYIKLFYIYIDNIIN